jgi:thiamine kinase-like enzyme
MANDILLRKFQNIKLTELSGGYTNSTLLLEGSDPLVISKIFKKDNSDARVEINSLTLLNKSDVSPRIHDYFEDNELLYIIMDYVHGVNSQRFLDNDDTVKAREIYKLLGIRLAKDIHSMKQRNGNSDLPIIELINVDIDSLDFVPSVLKNIVKRILNISVKEEKTLIHGDYGPHNTIISNDSMFVIDWEWAGWGNPLQDVAWVVWFVHLHYPYFCKELSEIFLNTYSLYSDIRITEELVKAFSISRVINILERIKNANIDIKNEWLRRLEWTLQTNFVR